MADNDPQGQLTLEAQINQMLQSRLGIMKAQEKALSNQVQLAVDLCRALRCEQLDDIEARLRTARQAMEDAARSAGVLNTELANAGTAGATGADRTRTALDKMRESISASKGAVVGFAAGLVQSFGVAYQTTKNLVLSVSGVISSLGKLSMQILAMPLEVMSNLFSVAQSTSGQGPSPVQIELEKLRGEFGNLSVATGKVAASALGQFRSQLGNVGKSGLSVAKIFGTGPEGMAAAIRENAELMKALGPAVDNFGEILQNNAGPLTIFRKGLGLTAEQQAKMMNMAKAMGDDPVKVQQQLASGALQMEAKFGIAAKKIGQDVATMQGDVANFGTMTREQMLSASVYTRKLGIEIKSLTGLVSAFDDFETAANNAAKLSQAFGMNVDAMKMMQEQDPTKRLSMLQQAFKQSGKAVEQMNRSELKLLESQTNMDEETLKLAFSQRGLSMSYDQVQKAADKTKKKQLSQEEVMKKLADSIERVFGQPAQTQFTGFFDAFSKGFNSGIMKSKEFKQVMRAINAALLLVFRAGRDVGKMFMALFPGIRQITDGLLMMFSPKRYGDLMKNVKGIFADFFLDLRTDPKAGVEKFVKKMTDLFKDFFEKDGVANNMIMEGGKTILKTLGAIISALLPLLLKGLTTAIKYITEFIKSPPGVPGALIQLFTDLFAAVVEFLKTAWDTLAPALGEMFMTLFEKVKPYLLNAGVVFLGLIFGKMILNAVGMGLTGGIIGAVGKKISDFFGGIFGGSGAGSAGGSIISSIGSAITGAVTGAAKGLKEVFKSLAEIKFMDIASAAATLGAITLIFLPAVGAFAAGLGYLTSQLSMGDALHVILIMAAIGAAAFALGMLADALDKIKVGMLVDAGVAVGIAAILIKGGLTVLSIAVKAIQNDFVGVDWLEVGKGFAGVLGVIGALVLLSKGVQELDPGKLKRGEKALSMAYAGAFVYALIKFVEFVVPLANRMSSLRIEPTLAQLKSLAIFMVFLVLISTAAASFTVTGPLGIAGLWIGSEFIESLLEFMTDLCPVMKKLSDYQGMLSGIDLGMLAKSLLVLTVVFAAFATLGTLAAIAGVATYLGVKGIKPIIEFACLLSVAPKGFIDSLTTLHQQISQIPDLKGLAVSMLALIGIISAIGVIASISAIVGPVAWVAHKVSSLISSYVYSLIKPAEGDEEGGLLTAVVAFSKRVGNIPNPDVIIAGAQAIMSVIKVIGSMTSLLPTLTGFGLLDAISGTAFPLLRNIVETIKDNVIPAVATLSASITGNPNELAVKVKAVSDIINAMIGISKFAANIKEMDPADLDPSAQTTLQKVSAFVSSVFGEIKGLADKLAQFNLEPTQVASVKVFAEVMNAIGNMMKGLSLNPETLKALRTSSLGGLTENAPDPQAIRAVTTYVTTLLTSISGTLPTMFGEITRLTQQISNAADMSGKVKALSDSFKVISDVAGIVGEMIEMTGGQENLRKVGTGGVVNNIIQILGGLINGFFNPRNGQILRVAFNGIKSLTESITGDVAAYSSKVKAVADSFDVLMKFATVIQEISQIRFGGNMVTNFIKDVKSMAGGEQSPFGDFIAGITDVTKTISTQLKTAFDSIKALADGISDPEKYSKQIGLVGETITVFAKFAGVFKDIVGLMPAGTSVEKVVGMIDKISDALFTKNVFKNAMTAIKEAITGVEFKDTFSPAGIKKIKSLGDVFKILGDFVKSIGEIKTAGGGADVTTTLMGISDALSSTLFRKHIRNILFSVGEISALLEENPLVGRHVKNIKIFSRNLSASMTALNNVTGPEDGLITKVSAIGASFLKLEEDMQRLGNDPNLKAVVKVGQSLKGNSKLTVKHEAVQINLSVDIKMDASKIGSGLIAWSDKDVPANKSERRFVTSERTNNFTVAAGSTRG